MPFQFHIFIRIQDKANSYFETSFSRVEALLLSLLSSLLLLFLSLLLLVLVLL